MVSPGAVGSVGSKTEEPAVARSRREAVDAKLLRGRKFSDSGRAEFVRGCLVDLIGIEPMTSSMPWKRAPSCATGPLFGRALSIVADAAGQVKKSVRPREPFRRGQRL